MHQLSNTIYEKRYNQKILVACISVYTKIHMFNIMKKLILNMLILNM